MVIVVMLFILSATGFGEKALRLFACPVQTDMQELNLCSGQNKIVDLKYRKKFTIWELGKNKFT
jgi:hypothetical protein